MSKSSALFFREIKACQEPCKTFKFQIVLQAGVASVRNPRRYSRVLFRFVNGRWRWIRRRQN